MRGLCNRRPHFFRRRRKSLRGCENKIRALVRCGRDRRGCARRTSHCFKPILPESGTAPACFPLFDRGGHEFPPTPCPRNARGGECAGAPPVAEKATKHSRQRRCRRKRKRRGNGLPQRWVKCAGTMESKTLPCLGRRTALDAWCIDVGPVGQPPKRPVWSPALEAGHSLHGSVPRALARRGPGSAPDI